MRLDFLTGNHNSVTLSEKYRAKRRAIWLIIEMGGWRREAQAKGIATLPEPKLTPPDRYPAEFWNKIEAEFNAGANFSQLSAKYQVGYHTLIKRAKRHEWKMHRDRLYDIAKARMAASDSASKMKVFEDMACSFIESATVKLRIMVSQLEKTCTLEDLETLISQYNKLYKAVHELPQTNRAKAPPSSSSSSGKQPKVSAIPVAMRPAPILKIT